MNADAELYAAVLGDAGVALDHGALKLDGAAHGVDHAAELDDGAIAGPLDYAAVVNGDGGVDQIAAQGSQAREDAILIGRSQPGKADDVGRQNRCELSGLAHRLALQRRG